MVSHVVVGEGGSYTMIIFRDASHTVYTHTHTVYTLSSHFLSIFYSEKILSYPRGLTVDQQSGLIYVADSGNFQIAVINATTNKIVRRIGKGVGVGLGYVDGACGLALDNHGHLLVADNRMSRVQVFNAKKGTALTEFQTPSKPYFVAVDNTGRVIVTCNEFSMFTRRGVFIWG